MARYLHLKSQKRVISFDPLLLSRGDVEIVNESQAKSLQRKYDDERRKTRDQNEQARIKAIAETSGVQLTGSDYEDDDVREERETRESRRAIKTTGDRVRPESHSNINNDPDMPGGVGEQWQAEPDDRDSGAQAGQRPEGVQAEGAAHKEAAIKAQHEQDLTLAQRIALQEQPEPEPREETEEEQPTRRSRRR
jgi:hypothetical protein